MHFYSIKRDAGGDSWLEQLILPIFTFAAFAAARKHFGSQDSSVQPGRRQSQVRILRNPHFSFFSLFSHNHDTLFTTASALLQYLVDDDTNLGQSIPVAKNSSQVAL
jgi:hypothetical protein